MSPFSSLSDEDMSNVVGWTIPRLNSRIQATKERGFAISHNFGCELIRLLTECQRRLEKTAQQVGQETDSAPKGLDIPADAVLVPRLAWDGFVGMMNKQLGKPANRDKTPAELIEMARAMLGAAGY